MFNLIYGIVQTFCDILKLGSIKHNHKFRTCILNIFVSMMKFFFHSTLSRPHLWDYTGYVVLTPSYQKSIINLMQPCNARSLIFNVPLPGREFRVFTLNCTDCELSWLVHKTFRIHLSNLILDCISDHGWGFTLLLADIVNMIVNCAIKIQYIGVLSNTFTQYSYIQRASSFAGHSMFGMLVDEC